MRSLQNMIHFKNNSGFTLLEVLVAVMIVAMIMGPLFLWQTSVMSRTYQASGELQKLFIARNFLVTHHVQLAAQQTAVKKETHKDPAMVLTYELKKIPDSSPLRSFKNVVLESVTYNWSDGKNSTTRRLVSCAYRKPESKQS